MVKRLSPAQQQKSAVQDLEAAEQHSNSAADVALVVCLVDIYKNSTAWAMFFWKLRQGLAEGKV
jgi:hypothetical protein